MNAHHITEDVKKTVLEFIADLRESMFTEQTEIGSLLIVELAFRKMSSETITDRIVAHVLPHKTNIVNRNVQFFIDKKREIFAGLPEDRIEYFAEMVRKPATEGGLNKEDRNVIWSYFDTLLILAEKYKKQK